METFLRPLLYMYHIWGLYLNIFEFLVLWIRFHLGLFFFLCAYYHPFGVLHAMLLQLMILAEGK